VPAYHIEFEPVGRRGDVPDGVSLLEAARRLGVDLISLCGDQGICGRCRIQLLSGDLSDLTSPEEDHLSPAEIGQGYRLACMAYPRSDCRIGVPPDSLSTPMRTQTEGLAVELAPEPSVSSVVVELEQPSLTHPLADAENLLQATNRCGGVRVASVDLRVLQTLSPDLRRWNWCCRVHVRGGEVVAVTSPHVTPLGLAVDLGSTKIAGYLVDLSDGRTLAANGMMNPQISYGEDIVSRITHAEKHADGGARLQAVVVEGLNQLIGDLCAAAGAERSHIVEAVIVGNTAMHHLLLGLPTRQLARAPFVPALAGDIDLKAREIGLQLAPGACLHMPPNIAGYVGGDHVAVLVATAPDWTGRTVLALDIGTNTEISLITAAGGITSLSCASGPAFEGYHIKYGTRATGGAIERVQITPNDVRVKTINDAPPIGICGSGILDAVAQLQLAGVLGENGAFVAGSHPNLRRTGDQWEFLLASADGREITVTQDDVREIQLAKAAIQTGIEVLLQENGVTAADIESVIIAGAFGTYIDVPNAVALGMLPQLPTERFRQVGNAAGAGARRLLLSKPLRLEARDLQARVRFIELAQYPGFARRFALNCRLSPASR
jgi:uncharacterized 2Fe-2S/4Fe-4S cluster protein (DUF4445 family)